MTRDSEQPTHAGPPNAEDMRSAAEAVISSGALGRSKVYGSLLRYLVEKSARGESPKEIEIAIDVLGRDTDFDVARDSAVRVYVHQLRKKLEGYYQKHQATAPWRLSIPKGQYTVEAVAVEDSPSVEDSPALKDSPAIADSTAAEAEPNPSDRSRSLGEAPRHRVWRPLIAVLLAANLILIGFLITTRDQQTGAADQPPWQSILEDEIPILVVMGDYYIFGELDEAGNVTRMIRDFEINSREDLDNLFAGQPELGWQYYDLNLSYLPEGSAVALNSLLPILHNGDKPVRMKMMSELTTRDLQSNHVVYVGYISALDKIGRLLFSISNLRLGENYDQLIEKQSGTVYTSDAGLPSFDEPFRDYGWFASFPSTRNTQLIVVAGMRDAGLIHVAQTVTEGAAINVGNAQSESGENPRPAFEALFEVRGLDRMNFNARQVYSGELDAQRYWEGGTL